MRLDKCTHLCNYHYYQYISIMPQSFNVSLDSKLFPSQFPSSHLSVIIDEFALAGISYKFVFSLPDN